MKMKLLSLFAAALMFTSLSAEKASANDRQIIGTLIGAATGALIGSKVGKGKGTVVATAVGTLIGATVGSNVSTGTNPWPQRVNQPVYTPSWQSPRPVVVQRTTVVKHVHVHKRQPKWKKRHHRNHKRVSHGRYNRGSDARYKRVSHARYKRWN